MARNPNMVRPDIQFFRNLWHDVKLEAVHAGVPAAELVRNTMKREVAARKAAREQLAAEVV